MLNFIISIKPGLPIYEQIIYAAKKAVVSGQLKPGDPFPSVREISRELKVNPNTVQKSINQLVRDNMLEIRPGIGSVIAEIRMATDEQRKQILQTEAERLVVESKRLSIKKKELLEAIEARWGEEK